MNVKKFNITIAVFGIIVMEIIALVKNIDGTSLAIAYSTLAGLVGWEAHKEIKRNG